LLLLLNIMKIINVIPIINIPLSQPQVLTYFVLERVSLGSLVLVPIHRRQVTAVIIKIQDISQVKQFLRKKANYTLKPISRIINAKSLIPKSQIKLAYWIKKYYACSLTLAFKTILPESLRTRKAKLPTPNYQPLITNYQSLHLVPDLGQIKKVLAKYINKQYIIYHGSLSRKQQFQAWKKIRLGQAEIIIGTRLACFAPFVKLKKIIINQEESDNYKSWDQKPYYDARRVVKFIAHLHNAKIVRNSIVPKLKVQSEKLKTTTKSLKLLLKNKRVRIIDMRNEQTASDKFIIFSEKLIREIKKVLQKNGQIILFHNRRAMGRFIICKKCGFSFKCPNCAVSLLDYKTILQCSHCMYKINKPNACQNCTEQLISFGVGTQKIEKEINKIFSRIDVMRLDSDIPEKNRKKIINDFKNKKIKILIGTQMLLQNNFLSNLTAIINADSNLNLPDYRASEKSFYMFTNLALQAKKLIIQTYNPKHFALNAILKNTYKDFYEQELFVRKKFFYPPFSKLIKLSFKHFNKYYAKNSAHALAIKLKNPKYKVLGPCPGFIPRIRNQYIYQIIIKLPLKSEKLKKTLLNLVPDSWIIDVDPINLL